MAHFEDESAVNSGNQSILPTTIDDLTEEDIFRNDLPKNPVDEEMVDIKLDTENQKSSNTTPKKFHIPLTTKRRNRIHTFETNPTARKRTQSRLLVKLRKLVDEFAVRCGYQIVVLIANPGDSINNYKVFGTQPLESVVKKLRSIVMEELEELLAKPQEPSSPNADQSAFYLPRLVVDMVPMTIDKMTQAQLRAFIPLMIKFSTGRGKPGWGKLASMPPWWPVDVLPWLNIRMDGRDTNQRKKMTWTQALRHVVKCCYKYHGREDLLYSENDTKPETVTTNASTDTSTSPIYTLANNNGTVTILEINQSANNTPMLGQMVEQIPTTAMASEIPTEPDVTVSGITGACNVIDLSAFKEAYYQDGQLIIIDEEAEQKYLIPVNEINMAEPSIMTDQSSSINCAEFVVPKLEIQ